MSWLGAFASELHLTPRDIDELTVEEFELLLGYLQQREKTAKAEAEQARKSGGR